MASELTGNIHSIETMGTMDGPGLRTVVFMQGCPLRCKFCHNIDVTIREERTRYTPEQLTQELLKNRHYWKNDSVQREVPGGVTFTGGDPVVQADFVVAVSKLLRNEGVHVCVESSLYTNEQVIDKLLPVVDYWMVSLKHMDAEIHKLISDGDQDKVFNNLHYLDSKLPDKRLRLRMVVIPGLTNTPEHVEQLNRFIPTLHNVAAFELLPYSTLGIHKWEKLFKKYWFKGVRAGTIADARRVAVDLDLPGLEIII